MRIQGLLVTFLTFVARCDQGKARSKTAENATTCANAEVLRRQWHDVSGFRYASWPMWGRGWSYSRGEFKAALSSRDVTSTSGITLS